MAKKNSRPNLAARKKANKAAEEKKLAARKAFWDAHKKQILTIAGIALAVIIAVSLIVDYCYVPSYSVRDFMGNLINVNENALIREIDGRYYEMGSFENFEGYVPTESTVGMISDDKETYYFFDAEDETKAIQSIYTIGVKDRTAADMISMVSQSFQYDVQTENKTAQIGGHDVHYFYSQGMNSSETPDILVASLTCYVDSIKDSCVLISLSSAPGAADTMPTEEAMLAEAESIIASFTINK